MTGALPKGEEVILTALIQYPNGMSGRQISAITGYAQQTRDVYVTKLVGRGLVARDRPGHVVAIQPEASRALPVIEPLPTGQALRDFWLQRLSKGESSILQVVMDAYPNEIDGPTVSEKTGYAQQTRDVYVTKMIGKEIIDRVKPGWLRASDTLFDS